MEKSTTKVHLEFDITAARIAYAGHSKKLTGEQVTSPFDLYSVERLRDNLKLQKGAAIATDVIVWGKGAPRDRRVTKISGLPFWPKTRAWPAKKEEPVFQFLAQFCFLDSKALVPKLPGDILLLFVPQDKEDWIWDNSLIHFEWVKAETTQLIDSFPKGIRPFKESEWYGVLHRTNDYPELLEDDEENDVEQYYRLPVLEACKIGGVPSEIQEFSARDLDEATGLPLFSRGEEAVPEHFLCQLTSIQAAPLVAYPWTNHKEPLNLEMNEKGIHGEMNDCLFGDMGSIYIFMDSSGKCTATMQCY